MALSFAENENVCPGWSEDAGGKCYGAGIRRVSTELKRRPKRRRILGEDLVLFRDDHGRLGLLELRCLHKGTSLEFGYIEDGGLRCCYHGWLYDVDGRVL